MGCSHSSFAEDAVLLGYGAVCLREYELVLSCAVLRPSFPQLLKYKAEFRTVAPSDTKQHSREPDCSN